jgi:hypothetical protein
VGPEILTTFPELPESTASWAGAASSGPVAAGSCPCGVRPVWAIVFRLIVSSLEAVLGLNLLRCGFSRLRMRLWIGSRFLIVARLVRRLALFLALLVSHRVLLHEAAQLQD